MRRRNSLIGILGLVLSVFVLQNCKHDPAISQGSNKDPDSLYTGKPFTIPNPTVSGQLYGFRSISVPADNPMTYEGVQLGRMLFYDSTLSLNKRVSCGSCHKQQYAFGDNTKLSQNVLGSTKRNTSTLINLGMNTKFFWDGRQTSIEDAVNDALDHEMHPDFVADVNYLGSTPVYVSLFKKAFGRPGDITEIKMVKAIAQFIRTLVSANSRVDQYYRGEIELTPAEIAGINAFFNQQQGDCYHCHFDQTYLTYTNEGLIYQNNGIDSSNTFTGFADLGYGAISGNERDNGKFKIPTLRNVALSAPYMHDGRFATLDEVLNHYDQGLVESPTVDVINLTHIHQGGLHLDAAGRVNLLAFLNALTDTSFIHNPAFSNPFH